MKTISIFLALVNSVIAGLLLAASLTGTELHEAALLWLLTKITAGSVVILVGALTWLAGMRALAPGVIALSSLFLTALGAATIVWTIHIAILRGDMEYYMVMYGGSLMLQGLTSMLGFAGEAGSVTAT
jgi:hypothetical protein